jgi:hypothetical protein
VSLGQNDQTERAFERPEVSADCRQLTAWGFVQTASSKFSMRKGAKFCAVSRPLRIAVGFVSPLMSQNLKKLKE